MQARSRSQCLAVRNNKMPKIAEAIMADASPAFTQAPAVLMKLKVRMSKECGSYCFRLEICVVEDTLPIPADRSKYKRFIRKGWHDLSRAKLRQN